MLISPVLVRYSWSKCLNRLKVLRKSGGSLLIPCGVVCNVEGLGDATISQEGRVRQLEPTLDFTSSAHAEC